MSLRQGVIGAGVLLLGLAVVLAASGARGGAITACVFYGVILAGSVLAERHRYKPEQQTLPSAPWVDTGERVVEEGHVVSVWFNPDTGERSYHRAP